MHTLASIILSHTLLATTRVVVRQLCILLSILREQYSTWCALKYAYAYVTLVVYLLTYSSQYKGSVARIFRISVSHVNSFTVLIFQMRSVGIKVRSVSVLTFNLAVSSAINRLNPPTGEELEYYQWYAIKLTLSVLVPFFYDIFRIFCKKSTLLRLVVVVLQQ